LVIFESINPFVVRSFLFILSFLLFAELSAQEQQLAYRYYRSGEYEIAAAIYETLHKENPNNTSYSNYLIKCYQRLELFDKAQIFIETQLDRFPTQRHLLVEIGYNHQLQHDMVTAEKYYQHALDDENMINGSAYLIGKTFQDNHLLDYAITAFKKAMELNPKANFNYQLAFIYGEKGELDNMFRAYLDLIDKNEKYLPSVQNYMGQFITDDSQNESNILLKQSLLKRSQNQPKDVWNVLLSWMYTQQKDYLKAFVQEKALFRRNPESLDRMFNLGEITYENNAFKISTQVFDYILKNTNNIDFELAAKLYKLEIDRSTDVSSDVIQKQFVALLNHYGFSPETLRIQSVYAEFLAFDLNQSQEAISLLKSALEYELDDFEEGLVKTILGDIYVYDGKFSTALIYYTQVQKKLKNDELGQEARFKIAQTSYYKGDFDWAQNQLKILKKSTSQLIANDALDLNLLITDNATRDSTKVALTQYAKAELLAFQNKNQEALKILEGILVEFKEHSIIDEALFKQAELFEKEKQYYKAEQSYLDLIALNTQDILADDAHYKLGLLYEERLENPEKAQEYYEKIIYDYPSSIYLVDARNKYRALRGDILN
jgi:tetratricopeptide (TPR) repeat protein